jgi:LacI family transcriptional regulator
VLEAPSGFTTPKPWRFWLKPLEDWLPEMTPPVGVLAVHDPRASLLVEACDRLGLRVPDDVAVVGVDNDPLTCQFARVPLTSVSRNDHEAGFQAAALLDRLMAGEPPPDHDIQLPPDGVVLRRSTDTWAVDDADILRIVRYVNEHINQPFGVERLEKLVPFSRRSLEQRFQSCLRCTPYEYILRARVRRAEEMLGGPSPADLGATARACGFADARRFRIVFRRVTGVTPTEYRRRRFRDLR